MNTKLFIGVAIAALSLPVASHAQGGAAAGATTGAVTGAIVGGPVGAAVGAGVGAVAGGIADEFSPSLPQLCHGTPRSLLSLRARGSCRSGFAVERSHLL